MRYDLTASVVTYNSNVEILEKVIKSFLNNSFKTKLFVVDNSFDDSLAIVEKMDSDRITYIHNPSNPGFGAAHNLAINKAIEINSEYHIILNPDIYFSENTIEQISNYINNDFSIGLIMPKILYPDGETQYLCKLLPTPFDLILRRFLPEGKFKREKTNKYELRFTGYNKTMDVPHLSGCFMFCRTDVLKEVGGFDERFFMYMEDVDLSRRVGQNYRTVYYPEAIVYHHYEKGSYRNKKLLKYHINSAIKYFMKWGWVFDSERRKINKTTLIKIVKTDSTSIMNRL